MMQLKAGLKLLAGIGMLVFMLGCAGNPFGDANVLPLNNAFKAGTVVAINSHAPVRLSVATLTDARKGLSGREVGTIEKGVVVYGVKGPQFFSDDSVSQVISQALRAQFGAGGYQIVDTPDADFQITGAIRDYQISIGARDKLSMMIDINLHRADVHAPIWSGEIALQDERFAGVSGNSNKTIVAFLSDALQKLTVKTYNVTTTGLMQARADLFIDPAAVPAVGATAGVKTLLQPSPVAQPSTVPAEPLSTGVVQGRLVVSTTPDRAGVYVDGVYYGLTPIEMELAQGIHALRIVRDGYKTVGQKVAVRQDVTTELPLVLER